MCCATNAASAENISGATAIRLACKEMTARYGKVRVNCAKLSAQLVADGEQWLVAEQDPGFPLHALGAVIARADGRILNVWRE